MTISRSFFKGDKQICTIQSLLKKIFIMNLMKLYSSDTDDNDIDVIREIIDSTPLPVEVHLLTTESEKYISVLIEAGVDSIILSVESTRNLYKIFSRIREEQVKVGISIDPETSVVMIEEILPIVDLVVILTSAQVWKQWNIYLK
ncbi:hypothetical protein G8B49_13860 [Enterococcus mundtii]|uniref:hypothetical protein n=1 Tax=Enterococcus mundtii TaxID=53346 RepID=UPI0018832495|nr:hypothetical protein [Enterococcus mundtii]MBE9912319.1 hypothetical protein [Enterococcus mundtii]